MKALPVISGVTVGKIRTLLSGVPDSTEILFEYLDDDIVRYGDSIRPILQKPVGCVDSKYESSTRYQEFDDCPGTAESPRCYEVGEKREVREFLALKLLQ